MYIYIYIFISLCNPHNILTFGNSIFHGFKKRGLQVEADDVSRAWSQNDQNLKPVWHFWDSFVQGLGVLGFPGLKKGV